MNLTGRLNQIGIALAAYKPDPFTFSEQLESFRRQDFSDWVCVITCDSPLSEFLNDPALAPIRQDGRFHWCENPVRLGTKKNFECAIRKVLDFGIKAVCCSDQDDIWYPNKLSVSLQELAKRPPLSMVHCDMYSLRNGVLSDSSVWAIERRGVQNVRPQHLIIRNVVAGCAMMFDPELARRYPIIPDGVPYHDHWYALCASYHGGVHPIHQALYAYRQHEKNELGVTPYSGLLSHATGAMAVLRKCIEKIRWSQGIFLSARASGLPVNRKQRWMFLSRWDFGVLLLLLGIRHVFKDPALSRACFARAVGKLLNAFKGARIP